MLKFTGVFWTIAILWMLGIERPPTPGFFITVYLLVMVPWGLGWLVVRAAKPRVVRVEVPVYMPAPVLLDPLKKETEPTPEELYALAEQKYQKKLALIDRLPGLCADAKQAEKTRMESEFLREVAKLVK